MITILQSKSREKCVLVTYNVLFHLTNTWYLCSFLSKSFFFCSFHRFHPHFIPALLDRKSVKTWPESFDVYYFYAETVSIKKKKSIKEYGSICSERGAQIKIFDGKLYLFVNHDSLNKMTCVCLF